MASNRKTPFGYEIRMGRTEIMPVEAEMVRWIYTQYAAGESYESLTRALQMQEVPYLAGKEWNKNMVARILADKRYLGTERFPGIIDESLFQRVSGMARGKAPSKKRSTVIPAIQRIATCAVCGAKVVRDSYRHGKERWYCPNCNSITTKATDARLSQEVQIVLTYLIQNPNELWGEGNKAESYTTEIDRIAKAFGEMLHDPDMDESAAKTMAIRLTAAQFNVLDSSDYEAMRIQYILASAVTGSEPKPDLLSKIASAVLINTDGAVSLKLKSGQVIERRDCI